MSKERIRVKQTAAELRNTHRRIKHIEQSGKPVPVVLFERLRELNKRLIR